MTTVTPPSQSLGTDLKHRFAARRKLLANREEAIRAAHAIQEMLGSGQMDALRARLRDYYPADLADIMSVLDDTQDRSVFGLLQPDEAAEVLDEVDECTQQNLVAATPPDRLARIIDELPSDEGTDIAGLLDKQTVTKVLGEMQPEKAAAIRRLLAYPKESAGGIMSLGFVVVPVTDTAAAALGAYRDAAGAEPLPEIYAVDAQGTLAGVLDLRAVLNADSATAVHDLMLPPVATVDPTLDREQVARIFARYNLTSLPVVESPANRLIGVITSDDMIDVIEAEYTEDMLRMAGSDAEELEKRSPARTAMLRLPWIMATMFIELGAGVVIHFYDGTLSRVLLLASFMPIISAISGNTGLQSATIVVRGLGTGQIQSTDWRRALMRQVTMTIILGLVCGLTLGVIGALWYGKWIFGLVVFVGMFLAVNIAGVVGTVVPLTSKRLGFDPAITSGPFETAFQDVVGISIFLTFATLLLHYLL